MRGLEEHLDLFARHTTEADPKHDFQNGTYVYKITNVEGMDLWVKFEDGWRVIGSDGVYAVG